MYFSLKGRKELFIAGRVGKYAQNTGSAIKTEKHRRLIQREKDNVDLFPAT